MRALLLFALVFLAACDLASGDGFFDDDYLSVYSFVATDASGSVLTEGDIGLTLYPSDVAGVPDGWSGRWRFDAASGADPMSGGLGGSGALRGTTIQIGTAGPEIELELFTDLPREGLPTESAGYFIRGTLSGDVLTGTWETRGGFTGGVLASGPFESRLTRAATRFIIAG